MAFVISDREEEENTKENSSHNNVEAELSSFRHIPYWLTDQVISFSAGGCRRLGCQRFNEISMVMICSSSACLLAFCQRWKGPLAIIAPSWSTQYWIKTLGACSLQTLSTVSPAPGLYIVRVGHHMQITAVIIRPHSVLRVTLKQYIVCAYIIKYLLINNDDSHLMGAVLKTVIGPSDKKGSTGFGLLLHLLKTQTMKDHLI